MPGQLSSRERELATLVAQLGALEADIATARALARHAHAQPDVAERRPPSVDGERIALADGAQIVIRPIQPDDARALAAGVDRLSALSRFRSFQGQVEHLSPRQADDLTHVDHTSHEALVALDAATGDGIGLARYGRLADDPTMAEVTCTVIDPWQRRGVGTALAQRLAARAVANGIQRFTAAIVVGDEPARRLLARVADEIGARRDGGTLDITAQVQTQP